MAAVVPDAGVPATVALLDMAAEGGGAALLDRGHDAPVRHRQRRTRVVTIGVAGAAEHVKNLQVCGVFNAQELRAIERDNAIRLLPRLRS